MKSIGIGIGLVYVFLGVCLSPFSVLFHVFGAVDKTSFLVFFQRTVK